MPAARYDRKSVINIVCVLARLDIARKKKILYRKARTYKNKRSGERAAARRAGAKYQY